MRNVDLVSEKSIPLAKAVTLTVGAVSATLFNDCPQMYHGKTVERKETLTKNTKTQKNKLNTNEKNKENTKIVIIASGKLVTTYVRQLEYLQIFTHHQWVIRYRSITKLVHEKLSSSFVDEQSKSRK